MAPELAHGSRDAQPASDVFSLGVIAFQVLTGSLPFERPPVLEQPPVVLGIPPLGARCPSLDPALAALLERCLALDPAQRPGADEVAARLAGAA
jgi:serine/threonine-protein kinase